MQLVKRLVQLDPPLVRPTNESYHRSPPQVEIKKGTKQLYRSVVVTNWSSKTSWENLIGPNGKEFSMRFQRMHSKVHILQVVIDSETVFKQKLLSTTVVNFIKNYMRCFTNNNITGFVLTVSLCIIWTIILVKPTATDLPCYSWYRCCSCYRPTCRFRQLCCSIHSD